MELAAAVSDCLNQFSSASHCNDSVLKRKVADDALVLLQQVIECGLASNEGAQLMLQLDIFCAGCSELREMFTDIYRMYVSFLKRHSGQLSEENSDALATRIGDYLVDVLTDKDAMCASNIEWNMKLLLFFGHRLSATLAFLQKKLQSAVMTRSLLLLSGALGYADHVLSHSMAGHNCSEQSDGTSGHRTNVLQIQELILKSWKKIGNSDDVTCALASGRKLYHSAVKQLSNCSFNVLFNSAKVDCTSLIAFVSVGISRFAAHCLTVMSDCVQTSSHEAEQHSSAAKLSERVTSLLQCHMVDSLDEFVKISLNEIITSLSMLSCMHCGFKNDNYFTSTLRVAVVNVQAICASSSTTENLSLRLDFMDIQIWLLRQIMPSSSLAEGGMVSCQIIAKYLFSGILTASSGTHQSMLMDALIDAGLPVVISSSTWNTNNCGESLISHVCLMLSIVQMKCVLDGYFPRVVKWINNVKSAESTVRKHLVQSYLFVVQTFRSVGLRCCNDQSSHGAHSLYIKSIVVQVVDASCKILSEYVSPGSSMMALVDDDLKLWIVCAAIATDPFVSIVMTNVKDAALLQRYHQCVAYVSAQSSSWGNILDRYVEKTIAACSQARQASKKNGLDRYVFLNGSRIDEYITTSDMLCTLNPIRSTNGRRVKHGDIVTWCSRCVSLCNVTKTLCVTLQEGTIRQLPNNELTYLAMLRALALSCRNLDDLGDWFVDNAQQLQGDQCEEYFQHLRIIFPQLGGIAIIMQQTTDIIREHSKKHKPPVQIPTPQYWEYWHKVIATIISFSAKLPPTLRTRVPTLVPKEIIPIIQSQQAAALGNPSNANTVQFGSNRILTLSNKSLASVTSFVWNNSKNKKQRVG